MSQAAQGFKNGNSLRPGGELDLLDVPQISVLQGIHSNGTSMDELHYFCAFQGSP